MIMGVFFLFLLVGLVFPSHSFNIDEVDFQIPDFEISYSEDGQTLALPYFLLQIFETDGQLPEGTYANVESALNEFLSAELNSLFAPQHAIGSVNSTVQTNVPVELDGRFRSLLPKWKGHEPSLRERIEWEENRGSLETPSEENRFLRGRRNLQSTLGSEMLMKVNVTFDRSPVPSKQEVNWEVINIMQNLEYLVSNLTATMDPELQRVFLAIRLELMTSLPTSTPPSPSAQTVAPIIPVVPTSTPVAITPVPTSDSSSGNISPPTRFPVAPAVPSPFPTVSPLTSSPVGPTSLTPTIAPVSPTSAPVRPTLAPVDPTQAPVRPTLAPVDPTQAPESPTLAPIAPTHIPTMTTPPVVVPTYSPVKTSSTPVGTPTNSVPSSNSLPSGPSNPAAPSNGSGSDNPTPTINSGPSTPSSPSNPTNSGSGSPESPSNSVPSTPTNGGESSSPAPPTSPGASGTPAPTEGQPVQIVNPGVGNPGDNNENNDDNSGSGMIVGAVIGTAAAAFIVVAAILLVRRRRRNEEEEVEDTPGEPSADFFTFLYRRRQHDASENDVVKDIARRSNPMSPMGDDSVFSGLTDILADTGSPRIRPAKSMSSATTVRANNVASSPFSMKSPVSMANGSTLFAFSEEGEEDESEPESQEVVLNEHEGGYNLSSKTPLRSNKASQLPSPSMLSGKVDPPATNGMAAAVVGGTIAAAGVAAVASRRNSRRNKRSKVQNDAVGDLASPDLSLESAEGAFPTGHPRVSRQHAGKGTVDGTSEYQETMHPLDWSFKSDADDDESSFSSAEEKGEKQFIFSPPEKTPLFSPRSERSKFSSLSGNSTPGSKASLDSDVSASRQLINDLVWLEQKIADVRTSTAAKSLPPMSPMSPGGIDNADSLSYASKDAPLSPSSHDETTTIDSNGIMQSIICRDCFAPPGKLQIVIHSTKDGPAVHSVKPGSSLEGHIFPGDLIIAVDNVDTRTFKAEEVMKMMSSKSGFERKITVLHFEN